MGSQSKSKGRRYVANYILDKELGKGTFARVRLAYHVLSMQPVALKIFRRDSFRNKEFRKAFDREVMLLGRLRHPHIARLYEIVETQTHRCIVLEYCSGGELFDYIVARRKLGERDAQRIFSQLVSAISYIHSEGVVHRDLKPENILLDSNMNTKLIDFGLGNTYNGNGMLNTFCGSPAYAPPEVLLSQPYRAAPVDVWSLGSLLYTLVCGRLPFSSSSDVHEIAEAIYRNEWPRPTNCSPALVALLEAIFIPDPEKRVSLKQLNATGWVKAGAALNEASVSCAAKRGRLEREVHQDALVRLHHLGYPVDSVAAAIAPGVPQGYVSAAYFLMVERLVAENMTPNGKFKSAPTPQAPKEALFCPLPHAFGVGLPPVLSCYPTPPRIVVPPRKSSASPQSHAHNSGASNGSNGVLNPSSNQTASTMGSNTPVTGNGDPRSRQPSPSPIQNPEMHSSASTASARRSAAVPIRRGSVSRTQTAFGGGVASSAPSTPTGLHSRRRASAQGLSPFPGTPTGAGETPWESSGAGTVSPHTIMSGGSFRADSPILGSGTTTTGSGAPPSAWGESVPPHPRAMASSPMAMPGSSRRGDGSSVGNSSLPPISAGSSAFGSALMGSAGSFLAEDSWHKFESRTSPAGTPMMRAGSVSGNSSNGPPSPALHHRAAEHRTMHSSSPLRSSVIIAKGKKGSPGRGRPPSSGRDRFLPSVPSVPSQSDASMLGSSLPSSGAGVYLGTAVTMHHSSVDEALASSGGNPHGTPLADDNTSFTELHQAHIASGSSAHISQRPPPSVTHVLRRHSSRTHRPASPSLMTRRRSSTLAGQAAQGGQGRMMVPPPGNSSPSTARRTRRASTPLATTSIPFEASAGALVAPPPMPPSTRRQHTSGPPSPGASGPSGPSAVRNVIKRETRARRHSLSARPRNIPTSATLAGGRAVASTTVAEDSEYSVPEVRGIFSTDTTTTLPVAEVVSRINKALMSALPPPQPTADGGFVHPASLRCQVVSKTQWRVQYTAERASGQPVPTDEHGSVLFEMEVVRLPGAAFNCVKFHRVKGTSNLYQRATSILIDRFGF